MFTLRFIYATWLPITLWALHFCRNGCLWGVIGWQPFWITSAVNCRWDISVWRDARFVFRTIWILFGNILNLILDLFGIIRTWAWLSFRWSVCVCGTIKFGCDCKKVSVPWRFLRKRRLRRSNVQNHSPWQCTDRGDDVQLWYQSYPTSWEQVHWFWIKTQSPRSKGFKSLLCSLRRIEARSSFWITPCSLAFQISCHLDWTAQLLKKGWRLMKLKASRKSRPKITWAGDNLLSLSGVFRTCKRALRRLSVLRDPFGLMLSVSSRFAFLTATSARPLDWGK